MLDAQRLSKGRRHYLVRQKKKVQYNTKHWGREREGKEKEGGCPPLFPQCLDWTSLEGGAEGRAEALGQGAKVI